MGWFLTKKFHPSSLTEPKEQSKPVFASKHEQKQFSSFHIPLSTIGCLKVNTGGTNGNWKSVRHCLDAAYVLPLSVFEILQLV